MSHLLVLRHFKTSICAFCCPRSGTQTLVLRIADAEFNPLQLSTNEILSNNNDRLSKILIAEIFEY